VQQTHHGGEIGKESTLDSERGFLYYRHFFPKFWTGRHDRHRRTFPSAHVNGQTELARHALVRSSRSMMKLPTGDRATIVGAP